MTELAPDLLLQVEDLRTHFFADVGIVKAVDGVSFTVRRGETLAVVGESGSGKSVTSLSIMRLIASPPGRIVAGEIWYRAKDGRVHDLAGIDEAAMRRIRGNDIAMIFQEPMTSLNPVYTVGDQIAEMIQLHRGKGRREAMAMAASMLDRVGIAESGRRLGEYPHELSGGMRQRVMIAMALSCHPALLIADEPTTALDVTIQAQILDLMRTLQRHDAGGMSILFITHDLGVVAEVADRVVVMYGGRVVEEGAVVDVFQKPRHPYTVGLLESIPRVDHAVLANGQRKRIEAIPGNVPNPLDLPPGCAFEPRCRLAVAACREAVPPLARLADGHGTRCLRWSEL
jgi:oligopeptide/dipeptide ABC transporter ATP-binding protein